MKKNVFILFLFGGIFVNSIYPNALNNFSISSFVRDKSAITGIKNHDYCVINNSTGDTIFINESFFLNTEKKFYCMNQDTLIDLTIKHSSYMYIVPSTIEITKYRLLSTDVELICSKSIENKFYCDICLNDFYFDNIKIIMSNYIDRDNYETNVKKIRCITISKDDLSIIEDVEFDLVENKVKK